MGNRLSKISLDNKYKMESMTGEQLAYYLLMFSKENLITEQEREAIAFKKTEKATKQAIFDLMLKKDDKSSQRMIEILKNDYLVGLLPKSQEKQLKETNVAQEEKMEVDTKPPNLGMPTEQMAAGCSSSGHVSLEEIRNLRLLSREWDKAAERILGKRLCATMGHHYNPERSRVPESVPDVSLVPLNYVPCMPLILRDISGNSVPWLESSLQEILYTWRNTATELFMEGIQMEKTVFNTFDMINLATMLVNITKLTVNSLETCRFRFPLKNLCHIKHLRFYECDVCIENGDKISPIVLELKDCRHFFADESADRTISNYIDFEEIEELIICEKMGFSMSNKLKIEFSGDFHLDLIILSNLKILNWSTSTWEVDSFALSDVEISGKCGMRIRELSVDDSLSSLDNAPDSVERLFCRNFTFTAEATLPNLSYVYLSPKKLKSIMYFRNSPTLTSIEIVGDHSPDKTLSTQFFPNSLKKLSIKGNIKLLDNYTLRAEVIIADMFSVESFRKLVSVAETQRVIWTLDLETHIQLDDQIAQIIRNNKSIIAVGPFYWGFVNYPNTKLSTIVDMKSDYYLFMNNRGWAINLQHFNQMLYDI